MIMMPLRFSMAQSWSQSRQFLDPHPFRMMASNHDDEEQLQDTPRPSKLSFLQYLQQDVDPQQCTVPLAAFCFMTGFIDSISFSAVFVWCGFQTGNFVQLAVALARLFEGPPGQRDQSFHKADQQALASLLAFNVGALFGRWGDHLGSHKRLWLIIGTFVQTLLTMAAALTIWKSGSGAIADNRGDPAWTNGLSLAAIIFMSASLGVQGIQGKRLNTQFTTTIVLTTVWVELMSDPSLFNLRRKVITRDHKLIAASSLFIGGFVSRAILGKIGSAGTLGVAVGLRALITLAWLFVPAKQKKGSEEGK
ncbi:hypothetical protein E1B28_011264 [Marasmius oreades]|uniref:DUF1275 domain protein n=1 Tax=Marasmius oreades TaxID=181124 RepID=A0A9P7UPD3_9AGAR|nr:uncharacterized protein E1B28_011264 [Marasmius oreades]KAG7089597.1 hypothetical protein E1B28_011264 [Marasmius oreades]